MPTRSSKKPRLPDPNVLAFNIVRAITGEVPVQEEPKVTIVAGESGGKNMAAVTLGRLGGMKGGLARAKKLSKKTRVAIARKAAAARWGNKNG